MYTSYDVQEHRIETTFWSDFSIADRFGLDAVRDTYKRAFKEWKTDYKYLAELVLVLNHKIWQWHEQGDEAMYSLYYQLWSETDGWALDNLRGDELSFYLAVLD